MWTYPQLGYSIYQYKWYIPPVRFLEYPLDEMGWTIYGLYSWTISHLNDLLVLNVAFMDESQQFGEYHEVASLVAIKQAILAVYVGDHRQTPGGLSKGRAASKNRKKTTSPTPGT